MPASPSPSRSRIRRTFRLLGTPPRGGYAKRSAFMRMKERGTRTPATATTVECSSFGVLGNQPADWFARIVHGPESSYIGHGWYIAAMAARGASGAPRKRAD